MTTAQLIRNFREADAKVNQIENNGGVFQNGYSVETTKEYDEALAEAQRLYAQLEELNVSPF